MSQTIVTAQSILACTPVVEKRPEPKGMTEADKAEYLEKVAAWEKEVKELPGKRKLYKAEVFTGMAGKAEHKWLELVKDFAGLKTGKASATDTMVSTWISDFRSAFKKAFPGKAIVPVKSGVTVTGYSIENVESQEVLKLAGSIAAMAQRFPTLFVKGVDVELIKETIKNEEQLARQQVILAQELDELRKEQSNLSRSLFEAETLVKNLKKYKAKIPAGLSSEVSELQFLAQAIGEGIARRTN